MPKPSPRPFSGARFFRWYAFAWLALAALYFVVFLITGRTSIPKALVAALVYVLPMAVLGTLALRIFRRLEWSPEHRLRFTATHVVLGLVFGVTVVAANYGLFTLLHEISETLFRAPQFNLEYSTWESLMGGMIYGVLAGVCYATLLHERMREQEARAARATALQTEAELRALRAQLNPHFLFNMLHSLLALVRHDPSAAENALEQFGDLLRYTLDTQKNGEVVPLGDELAFVENYLALESLRLGDRLRLEVEVDEAARHERVPAFSLQPLVENAIRHGIGPRAGGGRLTLRVAREERALRIDVTDDGGGADLAALETSGGLGLRLVRERLAAHYGGAASLTLGTGRGEGFRATIRIPIGGARA